MVFNGYWDIIYIFNHQCYLMSSFSNEIRPKSIFTFRKWIPSRSPGDTQKLGKLKELTQESNSFPWRCEGLAGFSWGSLVTHGIPRFSHQKKGSCFEHHSTDRSCLGQKTMVSWVSYKNIMAWSSNCGCSP